MPGVFDPRRDDLAAARARLKELTTPEEYRELRRTTLNAHYTHARYVQLIWDALGQLGFRGGQVLEPGCGSGNFIGLAPGRASLTGIERDPVTAAITAALYPHADIQAESFADTRIPAGFFDAVVGNVPFGKLKLSDPAHNPGRRLSIHNHFIVKALALTRPGGMAALLTSRYTMDSRNPEARRQISGLADLVAAIRLPTSAHRQAAGTDVVTDLLLFRRREPGSPAEPDGWALAPEADLPGGKARVNEYFAAHPGFVLGEMHVGRGARNETDLVVTGSADAAPALAAALDTAITRARSAGLVMTERADSTVPAPLPPIAPEDDQIEGLIQALPDGTFTRLTGAGSDLAALTARPYQPPATQARELRQLLGLRDTVLSLLRAEAATPDDSDEITRLRSRLNSRYNDYVSRYGPVKRFTWTAGRADPATGESKQIKRRPPQGGFRNDPLYPLAYALEERYNPATRTASRADIFTQRVVVPEPPLLGADTAAEALAICLNTHGDVRLEEIARLLGARGPAEARAELGTLVYDEPGTGRLIWAPLYLSGDVRAKLAAAQDAALSDPRFEVNTRALREVIPRDLGPAEIEAQLGAGWIGPEYVQQFLRETLTDDTVTVERTRGRKWKVSGGNRKSVAAASTWGTGEACAQDLTQRLLTGTAEQILIQYKTADGARVVDQAATEAARQKARDLADRFSIWIWEDATRAGDLSRIYNDRYNAVVPVNFDNVRLFTPGLSASLTLRKHQPAAIARIIYQGSAGLVHDTGAGKTLETIIGVRERQRLGLSHKPCFVVQKHKLTDFRDEFLRAYPGARLLVADTDDLTGSKRREFIARCATGNPTAIIMSREAFRSIPVSAERISAFLREEERALEQAVEDARNSGEDTRTIKQIEAELLSARERRKEQVARIGQDKGLCYEDTGIDYIVVDEARGYRKGPVVSSLPGMADPGSGRALDLLLKLGYHKELYGETRVCLADATPFTNRISEIYAWLRYLNPDLEDFDSWVRTFGKMATAYEMTPGGEFKAKARLREIINAVDLHLWLRELTDFKLKDSLDLTLPVMTGGKPEIVQVPAPDELIDYASEIAWRYAHLPKGPPKKGEDNHLKIQGDAIKSALDLRLVGRSTSQPQKADVTADVIFAKWLKHRDDTYLSPDGTKHPVQGSLILVFASLGTPGRTRNRGGDQETGPGPWDFYTELRKQLVARGMPGDLIRFIHDAANALQKEELFRACRNGEVAVLIGSTEKLGTGTNVQDRAVGLVQVTAPWNWDEPHQELGRVERQGNQNSEFFCIRVVTSPSADAIKWERARQKEHSFRALMSGQIEGRTIRIPDDDLSSAEVMAAASGDPRLLERAELEGTISRLHTLRRAWAQNQTGLGYTITRAEEQIASRKQAIAKIDAALARREDTRGDAFSMMVGGDRFTKRPDAARRLRELLRQHIAAVPRGQVQKDVNLGEIGGFTLTATLAPQYANSITLTLTGIPDLPAPLTLNHRDLPEKTGIVTRLENRLSGLEQARADTEAAIVRLTGEVKAARAAQGGSFPQQDELSQARARLQALESDLVGASQQDRSGAEPQADDTASPTPVHGPEPGPDDHRPVRPQNRDAADMAASPSGAAPQPAQPHPPPRGTRPGTGARALADPSQAAAPGDQSRQDLVGGQPASPGPGADLGAPAGTETMGAEPEPMLGQGPEASQAPHQGPARRTMAAGTADAADLHAPGARQALRDQLAATAGRPEAGDLPPAPAGPPRSTAGGLIIKHHSQGTLVLGTDKNDMQVRRLLREHGFRWSGNLKAWYLPRPWAFSTRDQRVTRLTAGLRLTGRTFAVRGQDPPLPAATSAPEPVPAAEPYTHPAQARADHQAALHAYWQLTRTPAGNRIMSTRPGGTRPDAMALAEAYRAVRVSWDQAFAGEPQQVADRFAAWMQAARALSANLTAERHRAPKFRTSLEQFIQTASLLAGRTHATAQDTASWARVLAPVSRIADEAVPAAAPHRLAGTADVPPADPPPARTDTEQAHSRAAPHPAAGELAQHDKPVTVAALTEEGRQAAAAKAAQANTALRNHDYELALSLLDEAELLYPDSDVHWDAGREQIRDMKNRAQGRPGPGFPAAPVADLDPAAGSGHVSAIPALAEQSESSVEQPKTQTHGARAIAEAGAPEANLTAGSAESHLQQATQDGAGRRPADRSKAEEIVASARSRARARDQAHVPIDYPRANAIIRRQRAALTRAIRSEDPTKVVLAAQIAVSEWDSPGMAWPDDWSRWQRALDDVLPPGERVLLEDLPARPGTARGIPHRDTLGGSPEAGAVRFTRPESGASAGTELTASPATNSDLAHALRRLPGWEFARLASQSGPPQSAGSRISRPRGEPDAGAYEEVERDGRGIGITIRTPDMVRSGHVSWKQVASWIDAGMTPARLGIIIEADKLASFCASRREDLIAAGTADPDTIRRELAQIRDKTIRTVISAALSTRGSAAPIPPAGTARPGYLTTAMTIRPDPAASNDENSSLERLSTLRVALRQLDPASDADIKTTIRQWIGEGLPDYIRALDKPAAMRQWITGHIATRVGRPQQVTYSIPGVTGGLWSGASPEGLLTARDGERRTESLIPWAELPAWIEPGIGDRGGARLLAADQSRRVIARRQLIAAVHASSGPSDRIEEEEKARAARALSDELAAVWAAIDAAPAPTSDQRARAIRTYQDATGPVQELLFGEDEGAGRPEPETRRRPGDPDGSLPPGDHGPSDRVSQPALPHPSHQQDSAPGSARSASRPPARTVPAGQRMSAPPEDESAGRSQEQRSVTGVVRALQPDAARHTDGAASAFEDHAGGTLAEGDVDKVLATIRDHPHAAAGADPDFADIRAAFAGLRAALGLPADATPAPRAGAPAPAPAPSRPLHGAARPRRSLPGADDFGDIRAAFTALRQALDLPESSIMDQARPMLPSTAAAAADASRLLDQAAAEAQARAYGYRESPEWQQITAISRATRDLITTIRQACSEYWAEIRRDIRVRGLVRTVAARVALAVSGAAHALAGRLEKSGYHDSLPGHAARRLHQASATYADRIMAYAPSLTSHRMTEVRNIIEDLASHPRAAREPERSRAGTSGRRKGRRTDPAALAGEGFPMAQPTAGQPVPPARMASEPERHRHSGRNL